MLVYVEFISRRPGVSIEAFHFAAGRGQTGWSDEHSDDVLLLNLGRTFRTGPEPEYLAVWYTPGAGLERMGEWERIFASGAADHLEETFRLAARIDTAGCYEALLEPAQGRDGLYYGEYLDVAPSAGRDEVTSYFSERAQRHDGLTLNLLCDRIGGLGPEPRCLAVWTVPGWDALGDVVRDLDGRGCTRTARARRAVPRSRRRDAVRDPVGVGFVGAGNVLPAYLQVLDRLVPRGLAREGPICARQQETWPELLRRRPAAHLVADANEVFESDVEVVVVLTPPAAHAELDALGARARQARGRREAVRGEPRGRRGPVEAGVRARPAPARRTVRAAVADLPCPLDDGARRRARARPLGARALRQCGLTLDDLVPLGRAGPARRGRDLQPQEPDGAPGPGRRGARGGSARGADASRRRLRDRTPGPGRVPRRPPTRRRCALERRVESGDPALPASRARAVRHCRHGEPAR